MKRILPLLIASPILMAFAPHADAAKIAGKAARLRPHFLKPGAVKSRIVANLVPAVFSIPQAPTSPGSSGTSNFFSGSFSSGSVIIFANSGSSIKTGSGTLNISGNGTLTQGNVSLDQGTVANWSGGTLNLGGSGGVIVSTSDPLVISPGNLLTINSNSVTGGTVSLTGGNSTIAIGGGTTFPVLELNGDSISGGPISTQGGILHVATGVTTSYSGVVFTASNLLGLRGRFILNTGQSGILGFWVDLDHDGVFELAEGGVLGTENSNVIFTSGNIVSTGWTVSDFFDGPILTKSGTGSLTIEGTAGDGLLGIPTLAGTSDLEASQTLDSLVINNGAVITLDALSLVPPFLNTAAGTSAALAAVPEPGSTFLLAIGALAASRVGRRRLR